MSTPVTTETAADVQRDATAELKLEVTVIPVADLDRAKSYYETLGWRLDADFVRGDGSRAIQFTPPGSPASIHFALADAPGAPGTASLFLVVSDIEAAREDLVAHGADVEPIWHLGGATGRLDGRSPDHQTYGSYASFNDPDGNTWMLQEVVQRLPGRVTGASYVDAAELEAALKRAASAHGEHEALTGEHDEQWPDWYARYMVAEQSGEELPR